MSESLEVWRDRMGVDDASVLVLGVAATLCVVSEEISGHTPRIHAVPGRYGAKLETRKEGQGQRDPRRVNSLRQTADA